MLTLIGNDYQHHSESNQFFYCATDTGYILKKLCGTQVKSCEKTEIMES